ncbi:HAD family hydrolase [Streptomonospora litoralis]|uniref:2-deoxyglucose-6-phosphate phosphatase n=1 Tax=Streptomonospora litoralis TaxID=2498135 RepID=A0A4P6Q5H0_9ACTN|nr:HAD family phosphatase [Streptomonospora litoralis]QBI54017.1 2-deoxyglucose-6-phosphate phosphatase [Streptomonospora litoralis]
MALTSETTRDPVPRAVLWDMDGTLVDSEPLWGLALDEVAAELGRPLDAEVREAITGTDDRTTMRLLARHTGTAATDAELEALRDRIVARVAGLLEAGVPVLAGALEAVLELRAAGIPQALVTSSPRRVAEISLQALGRDSFDAVVTAEDVTRRKPDPEPYLLAARLLAVEAHEAWAVEDSPSGALAAERAGCRLLLAPGALPSARAPHRAELAALGELLAVGAAEGRA